MTAWNNGQPPDIVWSNVGCAHPGLFMETSIDTMKAQMDVNYWSTVYLARATLKLWLQPSQTKTDTATPKTAKPRHFIMTSSVASFVGLAGYVPYAPTKAALRSLADTLHSEVNMYNGARRSNPESSPPTDIKIHCVCPATITSDGYLEEEKIKHPVTKVLEEGDPKQDEDEVAAASIKGLERGGHLVTTNFLGDAMRAGAMGGTPRNNWFLDTALSWAVNVAWLFIGPDMDGKVFKYGKKHGVDVPSS